MSPRLIVKLAALASTCWLSISCAHAENRLALVIGNSSYTSVSALPNPANDAKAMADFLSSAGFRVTEAPNLTQGEMRRTIGNFASMVAEKGSDTVAVVFYAGHGVQVDGKTFLVGVDALIEREADVPLQAVPLDDLMNALSSIPSKSRIVILDACRNNPFSAINKTSGRGLAIVDAPNGSLVSYSTAPGTEALDGDGANSPYTSALLKIGKEPGLPIEQVLKRVRLDVSNATNRQQFPWESSSLTDEFFFFAPDGNPPKPTAGGTSAKTGSARSESRSVEAWEKDLKSRSAREAYDIVVREDKLEAYQAYLALHPSEPTTPTVRTLIERRKVTIAWYQAVTINTVASYQTFLAAYGDSDFAVTANRLSERARSRSIGNAADAYASAAGACPCSQPTSPALRQRRTDFSPVPNSGGGAGTPSTTGVGSGPSSPGGGGTGIAVINPLPPVTVIDPVPPVIVTPPVIIPIRPYPPRGGDHPKPGGGTTTGTGSTGTGTGTTGTGGAGTGPVKGTGKGPITTTGTGTNSTGNGSSGTILARRTTGNISSGGNGSGNISGNSSLRMATKPLGAFTPMTTGRTMGGGMGGGGMGMRGMSFGRH